MVIVTLPPQKNKKRFDVDHRPQWVTGRHHVGGFIGLVEAWCAQPQGLETYGAGLREMLDFGGSQTIHRLISIPYRKIDDID